jgi:hypothetical protein
MKKLVCDKFRRQTKYGIYRWNPWFILGVAVTLNLTISMALGFPLYLIEQSKDVSNIDTYEDAVWLLWMAASTVGFGDVYPSEGFSRIIVGFMTVPGTMLIGSAINMASTVAFSWADNNVCNAELRAMIHCQDKVMKEMRRDMERMRLHLNVPDVVRVKNDKL